MAADLALLVAMIRGLHRGRLEMPLALVAKRQSAAPLRKMHADSTSMLLALLAPPWRVGQTVCPLGTRSLSREEKSSVCVSQVKTQEMNAANQNRRSVTANHSTPQPPLPLEQTAP